MEEDKGDGKGIILVSTKENDISGEPKDFDIQKYHISWKQGLSLLFKFWT